jgi:hypothetical protein
MEFGRHVFLVWKVIWSLGDMFFGLEGEVEL